MIRNVNVCAVGQEQSGISQSTGNQWRKKEFVVEWFENASDTQSQKVVLSLMNDNIDKLNIQVGDKLEVRFDLRYREYKGRYYMDVYAPADSMIKKGGIVVTEQPQTAEQAAETHPVEVSDLPNIYTNKTTEEKKKDDLPF